MLKSLSISTLFHSVLNSIVLFTVIYIIYFVSITETHHIATPSHIRHYHRITYAMQYYFPHRAHYHIVLYKQCTYHILCCINNAHITVTQYTSAARNITALLLHLAAYRPLGYTCTHVPCLITMRFCDHTQYNNTLHMPYSIITIQ